jgi:hypothetical protein
MSIWYNYLSLMKKSCAVHDRDVRASLNFTQNFQLQRHWISVVFWNFVEIANVDDHSFASCERFSHEMCDDSYHEHQICIWRRFKNSFHFTQRMQDVKFFINNRLIFDLQLIYLTCFWIHLKNRFDFHSSFLWNIDCSRYIFSNR